MSPALAGGFSTTAPPGKPVKFILNALIVQWDIFSLYFVTLTKPIDSFIDILFSYYKIHSFKVYISVVF